MCAVWILLGQQCQLFTGPIVRPQIVVAQRQEVQRIGRHRLVGIDLHDLFKAVSGGQIGFASIVESSDKEMHLGQQIMAFVDLFHGLAVVSAPGIIPAKPLE